MSKHRKHRATATDSVGRLKALCTELAEAYGLPEADPRIGQAAITKLNQQNWESRILLGHAVPSTELQRYTNTIAKLLGQPPTSLKVKFVYTCFECRKESDTDPEETAQTSKTPSTSELSAPVAPAEAAPTPEAPNNVTPLRPPMDTASMVALVNLPSRTPFDPPPGATRWDNNG
jgi:hypothetical protein